MSIHLHAYVGPLRHPCAQSGSRAVKIEGRKENSGGGIVPLGLSGLQLLYGHSRVPGPLEKQGRTRAEGHWDHHLAQAVEEVASKLADIRTQGNPESVACPGAVGCRYGAPAAPAADDRLRLPQLHAHAVGR
jgi:anaerobic selenocysteine-containing dehydrogenase